MTITPKSLVALFAAIVTAALLGSIVYGLTQQQPEEPAPVRRTPVPGADRGGLFADGNVDLPRADTAGWKTYTNATYGYSFQYPADWILDERDATGFKSPQGRQAYPLHAALVQNPKSAQGQNIPGSTCQGNECVGPNPNYLAFEVKITNVICEISGNIVAQNLTTIAGRQGNRCVVELPNDKSRTVSISISRPDGLYTVVTLELGRQASPASQAILETILSTLTLK